MEKGKKQKDDKKQKVDDSEQGDLKITKDSTEGKLSVEDKNPSLPKLEVSEQGPYLDMKNDLSISPRDQLSFVDDRRAWKDFEKFGGEMLAFNRLLHRLQKAVMENKPSNIPEFIAEQFFSEENQIELRREIKELKEANSAAREGKRDN